MVCSGLHFKRFDKITRDFIEFFETRVEFDKSSARLLLVVQQQVDFVPSNPLDRKFDKFSKQSATRNHASALQRKSLTANPSLECRQVSYVGSKFSCGPPLCDTKPTVHLRSAAIRAGFLTFQIGQGRFQGGSMAERVGF